MPAWKKILNDEIPLRKPRTIRNKLNRVVSARLFTDMGWIVADIQVPIHTRFIDFLSHTNPFLSLTSAFIEHRKSALDFFAIKKQGISFMAVMDTESPESASSVGVQIAHNISCLIAEGAITGNASIHQGVRVSDYFARHRGFVHMQDCHFRIHDRQTGNVRAEKDADIILNSDRIVGLCELPLDGCEAQKTDACLHDETSMI